MTPSEFFVFIIGTLLLIQRAVDFAILSEKLDYADKFDELSKYAPPTSFGRRRTIVAAYGAGNPLMKDKLASIQRAARLNHAFPDVCMLSMFVAFVITCLTPMIRDAFDLENSGIISIITAHVVILLALSISNLTLEWARGPLEEV